MRGATAEFQGKGKMNGMSFSKADTVFVLLLFSEKNNNSVLLPEIVVVWLDGQVEMQPPACAFCTPVECINNMIAVAITKITKIVWFIDLHKQ